MLTVLSYVDLILSYFVELEEKYGATLVSHLLAYITASKHGLTEPEILDVLALDTEVRTQENITCLSSWIHPNRNYYAVFLL